ncbi:WxL domain-containing protein [Enterococcus faecalis]|uniref:WxL domain-containing protein n=1 Tax=Enterococcus faecalis TaxID=1351 RepID=UPI0003304200|nr:WxL domain-containing protein [Enterococcus faecalis]EOJ58827.1 hypothetical protein WMM_02206 [Enterococcus faecalis EnGen0364]
MKKKLTVFIAVLLIVLGMNTSADVFAEEDKGMKSVVSLELFGELRLKEVPTFSFGRIDYDGTSQTVDLPENQALTISDKTGSGESWRVTVSFKDSNFKKNNFKMNIKSDADSQFVVAAPSTELNGDESSILQASSAKSYSKDPADYTLTYANGMNNQLVIPDNAKVGAYKTTLKWDLESTP